MIQLIETMIVVTVVADDGFSNVYLVDVDGLQIPFFSLIEDVPTAIVKRQEIKIIDFPIYRRAG